MNSIKSNSIHYSKKHLFPHVDFYCVESENHPEIPLHTHDFGEIVFVIDGSATHVTEHGRYEIQRGDVFVIDGVQKHGYFKTKNLHLIDILYCHNHLEQLKEKFSNLPGFNVLFVLEPQHRKNHNFKSKLRLNETQLNKIIPLLKTYIEEAHLALPWGNIILESFFKAIVIETCRFYSNNKTNKAKQLFRIEKVINYINDNIDKQISLDELADVAGLNDQVFRILFKKTTGHTPTNYIIAQRIFIATNLFALENLSVSNVAERVGFQNKSYFVRKFKEIMGVTPGTYAKSRIK